MILAVADVPLADISVRHKWDCASAGGEDMEGMEKNNKMRDSFHPPGRSYAVGLKPPASLRPSQEKTTARGMAGSVVPMIPAASRWGQPRNNPFDGWVGSAIKCASCRHVRPPRATPFLGLSLPIR
jgi:hypothetical protein